MKVLKKNSLESSNKKTISLRNFFFRLLGNGQINIAELGLGSAEEVIESMNHADEQLADMEKPFEQKLAESKEADKKRDAALEEKKKRENPKAPHLVNLNEDI